MIKWDLCYPDLTNVNLNISLTTKPKAFKELNRCYTFTPLREFVSGGGLKA